MGHKVTFFLGDDVAAFLATVGNKSDYVDRAIRYSFLFATVDEQILKQTLGALHQLANTSKTSNEQWQTKVRNGRQSK